MKFFSFLSSIRFARASHYTSHFYATPSFELRSSSELSTKKICLFVYQLNVIVYLPSFRKIKMHICISYEYVHTYTTNVETCTDVCMYTYKYSYARSFNIISVPPFRIENFNWGISCTLTAIYFDVVYTYVHIHTNIYTFLILP